MAYSDVMTSVNRRRPAQFGNAGSMQGAAGDQYNEEQGYGSDASSTYLANAKAFDPSAAINNYAQGAWGSISDALKKNLATQQGQEVGAGRFDSGFNDMDAGSVYNTATKQLSDSIAQQSVAASGQQLANNNGLAQFGENQSEDANQLLSGEREYEANQAQQRLKNRSAKGSAIGGAIGAIGGSFIPGVGTAIGGTIGSALGGLF